MATNKKKTSSKIATIAANTLSDKTASTIAKSLAASALSQSSSFKQTGSEMESKASKVLQSNKYNKNTKALAASVLSQSNREQ